MSHRLLDIRSGKDTSRTYSALAHDPKVADFSDKIMRSIKRAIINAIDHLAPQADANAEIKAIMQTSLPA